MDAKIFSLQLPFKGQPAPRHIPPPPAPPGAFRPPPPPLMGNYGLGMAPPPPVAMPPPPPVSASPMHPLRCRWGVLPSGPGQPASGAAAAGPTAVYVSMPLYDCVVHNGVGCQELPHIYICGYSVHTARSDITVLLHQGATPGMANGLPPPPPMVQ